MDQDDVKNNLTGGGGMMKISARDLQAKLGLSRQLAHYWVKHGIPVRRVPEVALKLGVKRSDLRPDYW